MDERYGRGSGDAARPGVAPAQPRTGPVTTVEVDGEVFELTSGPQPGSHHYTWVSGPNDGYGFSQSGGSSRQTLSADEHRESIRGFLAMIDPQTGYIGDD